jgi:predicted signal transduction protein with EAL and GGDEF domain
LAASAGASVFPADGTTYEALLADADHRMYRDKTARRGAAPVLRAPRPEFVAATMFETPDTPAATPLSSTVS